MRSLFLSLICICLAISVRAQSNNPSPNDFIDVQKEPIEDVPLEQLVVYPKIARDSGLEGTVTLEALIDTDGHVLKVSAIKSDYDIFKNAAIDAMKLETFSPAMQNGKSIKVWITRRINFRLSASHPRVH